MNDDTAGILVPPPLIFLGALVLGLGLDAGAPLGWPWPSTWPTVVAAIVLAGLGAAIIRWQFATFRQVGTPVPTSLPTKALATAGPYRFSRNPGYGATAFLYLALALAFMAKVDAEIGLTQISEILHPQERSGAARMRTRSLAACARTAPTTRPIASGLRAAPGSRT
jgi:hypothetical protein